MIWKIKMYSCITMWLSATLITIISIISNDMTISSKVNGTCVGLILLLVTLSLTLVFKPFNK